MKKFRKRFIYIVEREFKPEAVNHLHYTQFMFSSNCKLSAIRYARNLMAQYRNDVIKYDNITLKEIPFIYLRKAPNEVPINKKYKIVKTTFELTEDLKWKKTITKITNP